MQYFLAFLAEFIQTTRHIIRNEQNNRRDAMAFLFKLSSESKQFLQKLSSFDARLVKTHFFVFCRFLHKNFSTFDASSSFVDAIICIENDKNIAPSYQEKTPQQIDTIQNIFCN